MVSRDAGLHAWELADRLAAGRPSIQVRDDLIEHGCFFLDPCNLTAEEAIVVGQRIEEEVASAQRRGDGLAVSLSERRRRRVEAVLKWPD